MTFINLAFLENHLWQSTLCAAGAWLLTLVLRRNRAAVRYWLWLAASVKFLVPFAALVAIGSRFRWRTAEVASAPIGSMQWTTVITDVGRPFVASRPLTHASAAATPHQALSLSAILFVIWFGGFVVITSLWIRNWMRARTVRRNGTRLNLALPIPAISSSTPIEPGVFGILRPVLLLPEGIETRLTPNQLEAIVAHEMCHVRRRDNLLAAIHMAVEAIFWFYPPVWWIGTRMVDERERACDEEVLGSGRDPEPYAQGILNVCKLYTESPLACASGISGSDLKSRIVRIMKQRAADQLSFSRKVLLGSASVAALVGPLILGAANVPLRAQSQPAMVSSGPLPSFEVASIKPNRSGDNRFFVGVRPGRFVASSTTRLIIEFAYDIHTNDQLQGVPHWVDSDRYDINAKIADPEYQKLLKLSPEQQMGPVRSMVQLLLGERYGLKVNREIRNLPVYALVLANGGPKLTEVKGPQPKGFTGSMMRRGSVAFTYADMSTLADVLSSEFELGGRVVLDETGLKGKYDFSLHWTPSMPEPIPQPDQAALNNPPPSESSGPSLFTAVKEQLGLQLEARKAPIPVVVIDSIQKPSPN